VKLKINDAWRHHQSSPGMIAAPKIRFFNDLCLIPESGSHFSCTFFPQRSTYVATKKRADFSRSSLPGRKRFFRKRQWREGGQLRMSAASIEVTADRQCVHFTSDWRWYRWWFVEAPANAWNAQGWMTTLHSQLALPGRISFWIVKKKRHRRKKKNFLSNKTWVLFYQRF